MFDGGGFFLQVNPSGGKHWKRNTARATVKGLLTFGGYPTVSREQARRMRDKVRPQKASGLDPGKVRRKDKAEREKRAKNTFEAVARSWMEVHATKVEPQTMDIYESVLKNYVFPMIGRTPVKDLKAPDFLEILRILESQDRLCTIRRVSSVNTMISSNISWNIWCATPTGEITTTPHIWLNVHA